MIYSKVAIMTFHRAVNYGAVFQAYALKEALCSWGYLADIIDYRCEKIENVYYPQIRFKPVKIFLIDLFMYFSRKKKWHSFSKCIGSKLLPIKFDVSQLNKEYNVFIVGSDQVWNYSITGDNI